MISVADATRYAGRQPSAGRRCDGGMRRRRAGQALDQLGAAVGAVVLARPGGDLAGAGGEAGSARTRRAAQRSGPGRQRRQGSERPTPAQETRIAVSPMSPAIGEIRTGVPAPSARADRPVAAVADHQRRDRHQLAVAQPVDEDGVGGDLDRLCGRTRLVVATTRTGSSASAASAVRTRWFSESWAVLGATRTSGASPGGSSMSGWGTSKAIGPVTSTEAGQARGYSSCG